ncbi:MULTISPECIES: hypothetical protein [Myroides]|uniref:hypothetical protein n=1 Tax=Myroides TaxID=76831 RepID=UPI0025768DA2|nr:MULTISPECIES: hypothetical protein [Myroides]MDM1353267.1 hypothetical protein [Myroides marinus]MDM1461185.1 hypothetical protein [Myroides odoratimimus]
MKVLFEGVTYPEDLIKSYFNDRFHITETKGCRITSVGYCYNNQHQVCYILPKLFIDIIKKQYYSNSDIPYIELAKGNFDLNLISSEHIKEFKAFLILFYKSLKEYKTRKKDAYLLKENNHTLISSFGQYDFSFLDLLLSIIEFYKTHRNTIIFTQKQIQKNAHKKVNWSKTIRNSTPFFIDGNPIYEKVSARHKAIDTEEDLMVLFESIVYHIKNEYGLHVSLNNIYEVIKGQKFQKILNKGAKPLKKIKYKYFSDTMKSIYNMVELFLSKSDKAEKSKHSEDYIIINSYHQVFEDMVDKLLTSQKSVTTENEIALAKLKNNKDGKIIDHIFAFKDLLSDDSTIYYIADSKYYLPSNKIDDNSVYKQFTYAKNTIQLNIDLLNKVKNNTAIYYRDELTEGYNITPNFFIKGKLSDLSSTDLDLKVIKNSDKTIKTEQSYHFKHRLFDRDTLSIIHYSINYMYVLDRYVNSNALTLKKEQNHIYNFIRKTTIEYLSSDEFLFKLKVANFSNLEALQDFVNTNFRLLHGKVFRRANTPLELIIALDDSDIPLKEFIASKSIQTQDFEYPIV